MAGHSKWANIKHKKGREDARRGKIFTRLVKEITVAARDGGGDPNANSRLRLLIDKAKKENMPADNITRAIKKGTGELQGESYDAIVYEGYGPGGIAVIVETLTDNKKRTVSDVRHVFTKMGGNLGEANSVSWMFDQKGVVTLKGTNLNEDDVLEKMLDYNVEDIKTVEQSTSLICSISELAGVKAGAEGAGFEVEEAELAWIPKNYMELDPEAEEKAFKFLEKLEDVDDVQSVHTNLA